MTRQVIKYVVMAVVFLNLTIFLGVLLSDHSKPKPLPHPNGYDFFVKAGQLVQTYNNSVPGNIATPYADSLDREQLVVLISSNQAALQLIREGLSNECRVPLDYSANYANSLLRQNAPLKSLERLITGEGRLAEWEGRTNDAARIYLEGVRFGQECGRGGVFISRVVGVDCEVIALSHLQLLAHHLDTTNSLAVVRALEMLDTNEEPARETIAQDGLWARRVYGIREKIQKLIDYQQRRHTLNSFVLKVQEGELARRKAMIAYAAHAYEQDKDKLPQRIGELTPDYLKAIPKDPATGKDMKLGWE